MYITDINYISLVPQRITIIPNKDQFAFLFLFHLKETKKQSYKVHMNAISAHLSYYIHHYRHYHHITSINTLVYTCQFAKQCKLAIFISRSYAFAKYMNIKKNIDIIVECTQSLFSTRMGAVLTGQIPPAATSSNSPSFYPNISKAYPWLTWNLCMKFDDCRCKGKAVTCMYQNPFWVITALWPWPLTFWLRHP